MSLIYPVRAPPAPRRRAPRARSYFTDSYRKPVRLDRLSPFLLVSVSSARPAALPESAEVQPVRETAVREPTPLHSDPAVRSERPAGPNSPIPKEDE